MKPTILICTDSPYIDTGFARVGREIATYLQLTGRYDVVYYGWFHRNNDKLLPFRVIPTDMSSQRMAESDKYGKITYDFVVDQIKPDVVLVIGDEWMIQHYQARPRKHKLVAYVPIDGSPMTPAWATTLRGFDQVVLYGDFGKSVVSQADRRLGASTVTIPHGVDVDVFKPLPSEARSQCRSMVVPEPDKTKFLIGCVARNNTRKQIPRLLRTFASFVRPWMSCTLCGTVGLDDSAGKDPICKSCGGSGGAISRGQGATDAMLYLHMCATDPAGHNLTDLIHRFGLNGFVGMPDNMQVGRGVPDEQLNYYYNAFDLFTLPTGGEGWGLPILEAMSAGLPVLVTDYSGHVDFVKGAGEFISVAEWDVCEANSMDRALVDLTDYWMKLDRFYLEREPFLAKWGRHLECGGFPMEARSEMACGRELRAGLGRLARERALNYNWPDVCAQWDQLFAGLVPVQNSQILAPAATVEVV